MPRVGALLEAAGRALARDYMDEDVTAGCTCAVSVRGMPGDYVAVIMVRNIHSRARAVEVNALAIGD